MNHFEAKDVFDSIVLSGQSLYARAVSWLESHYGASYPGMNNFGSIHGSGDAGSFEHTDTHEDGTPYTTSFARYSTPEVGARAFARLLLKPNVVQAISENDISAAVAAQRANGYFEAPLAVYEKGVRIAKDTIVKATGEEDPFLDVELAAYLSGGSSQSVL